MPRTNLTAEQAARLAAMPAADRQDWANYYAWKNEEAEEARREAERTVRALVAERGAVEPNAARQLVGLGVAEFNAMIRFLKFTGGYAIDEAGLLVAQS